MGIGKAAVYLRSERAKAALLEFVDIGRAEKRAKPRRRMRVMHILYARRLEEIGEKKENGLVPWHSATKLFTTRRIEKY